MSEIEYYESLPTIDTILFSERLEALLTVLNQMARQGMTSSHIHLTIQKLRTASQRDDASIPLNRIDVETFLEAFGDLASNYYWTPLTEPTILNYPHNIREATHNPLLRKAVEV